MCVPWTSCLVAKEGHARLTPMCNLKVLAVGPGSLGIAQVESEPPPLSNSTDMGAASNACRSQFPSVAICPPEHHGCTRAWNMPDLTPCAWEECVLASRVNQMPRWEPCNRAMLMKLRPRPRQQFLPLHVPKRPELKTTCIQCPSRMSLEVDNAWYSRRTVVHGESGVNVDSYDS